MSIISVDHLTKSYGGLVAVNGVSLAIEAGEIFGILGRNGAGKTTLVECVEGLRRADAGTVTVAGLDPHRDRAAVRQILGAQLQQAKLPGAIRVGEALALYRSFYRDGEDPHHLAVELGLGHAIDTAFSDLSGGQQQRLSVALALVGRPQIAILDEVTTGLDPHARQQAWELIERVRDRGVTVVLVTHLMDEAERLCDRIAIIDQGRIAAVDTAAGLIERVGGHITAHLRLSAPLDTNLDMVGLTGGAGQNGAVDLSADGQRLTVTGPASHLHTTLVELDLLQRTVTSMRLDQPNLSDAFLALTTLDPAEVAA